MHKYNIDLDSLKKLRDIFGDDGEMEMDRFVEAFGSILGDNLSQQDLTHLFMKIDANSDGSVDWDEFTNYMFLSNQQDGDSKSNSASDMRPKSVVSENSVSRFHGSCGRILHKEAAVAGCFVDRSRIFLTAGRDGLVNAWNTSNGSKLYSFHTNRRKCSANFASHALQTEALRSAASTVVQQWNSDATLGRKNPNGTSTDLATNLPAKDHKTTPKLHLDTEEEKQYEQACHNLLMGYDVNQNSSRRGMANRGTVTDSILGQQTKNQSASHSEWGRDWVSSLVHIPTAGKVAVGSLNQGISFYDIGLEESKYLANLSPSSLYHCVPTCLSHCEIPSRNRELFLVGDDDGGVQGFSIENKQWKFQHGQLYGSNSSPIQSSFRIKYHSDHVTAMTYASDMSSLLTSSLDGNINVLDIERQVVRRSFTRHQKAVYTFAWSPVYKYVVSSGLGRDLLMWSPYSNRLIVTLQGHTSPVLNVEVNDADNQILSYANDNTLKIWDTRSQRCFQTIHCDTIGSIDDPGMCGGFNDNSGSNIDHSSSKNLSVGSGNRKGQQERSGSAAAAESSIQNDSSSSSGNSENQSNNKQLTLGNNGIMNYIPQLKQIITCKRSMRMWDLVSTSQEDTPVSNKETKTLQSFPIVGALYNPNFHQVVSLDSKNALRISNVDDGTFISKFRLQSHHNTEGDTATFGVGSFLESMRYEAQNTTNVPLDEWTNTHANNLAQPVGVDITCLAFDDSGRRLLTGSLGKGEVNIWNFSNGCLLRKLTKVSASPMRENELQGTSGIPGHTLDRHSMNLTKKVTENVAHDAINDVLYVVCELPKTPGCPIVRNKYIVAAGSQGIIYVWQDNVPDADSEEQGYTLCFPTEVLSEFPKPVLSVSATEEQERQYQEHLLAWERHRIRATRGHKDDITCLEFVPPNLIVSGGADGFIKFWNINNGDTKASVCNRDVIVSLHCVKAKHLLLGALEGGSLCIVSTNTLELLCTVRVVPNTYAVTSISSDETGNLVCLGDSQGNLHLCQLSNCSQQSGAILCGKLYIRRIRKWNAHESVITSVGCFCNIDEVIPKSDSFKSCLHGTKRNSTKRKPRKPVYWISASVDTNVFLWSSNGICLGSFQDDAESIHRSWKVSSRGNDVIEDLSVEPLVKVDNTPNGTSELNEDFKLGPKQLEVLLASGAPIRSEVDCVLPNKNILIDKRKSLEIESESSTNDKTLQLKASPPDQCDSKRNVRYTHKQRVQQRVDQTHQQDSVVPYQLSVANRLRMKQFKERKHAFMVGGTSRGHRQTVCEIRDLSMDPVALRHMLSNKSGTNRGVVKR